MKKNLFVFVLFLIGNSWLLEAQDLHFSQFYATPIASNPAESGRIDEDWRVAAIHRNQWSGIQSGFVSTAISADMNFKGGFLNHDKIGLGVLGFNDDMGGIIRHMAVGLSLAYHHTLDYHKRHHISIGVQGMYSQKSLNQDGLRFMSQYEKGLYYNEANISGESLGNQIANINLNAGVYYMLRLNNHAKIKLGFSTYQLTAPKESLAGTANELSRRYMGVLGGEFHLGSHFVLEPFILYTNQSNAQDINPGMSVGYDFGSQNHTRVYVGGWYRNKDAAIGMIGLGYKRMEARFSYDKTISSLNEITKATNVQSPSRTNAWEVSFIIKGLFPRAFPDAYTVPCGIF